MRDVAARAGVSQSTVSFVLNDRREMRIAEETRQRVLAAVAELGFRPDHNARALRTRRTHTFGMLTDEIASSPFAGRVVLGSQEVAWAHGRLLLMINTEADIDFETAAAEALLDRRVDGLLCAAQSARPVVVPERARRVPAVLVNCYPAAPARIPAIVPGEVHGGYLATRAVLDAGHRKIAFLAGDYPSWATRMRARGMRRALRGARLGFTEDMVIYGDYLPSSGYDRIKQVMARPKRRRPTAVLCANDRVAMGVLFGLHELGLRVPDDISVVGYDNQEFLADSVHPPLTTISLPHYEMGAEGVRALLKLLEGESVPSRRWLRGQLIVRASVGSAAQH
jgi:LacI family transcriptional regulator